MMRCTLAAGGVLFFALIGFTWYAGHREPAGFANLAEAKEKLSNAGFLCFSANHPRGDVECPTFAQRSFCCSATTDA